MSTTVAELATRAAAIRADLPSTPGEWVDSPATPLPSWLESFRPHQLTATGQILEAFTHADVVFYNGPTGAGKSLVAELVRRAFPTRGLGDPRALYIATTKALQDQLASAFPYAAVLKGRANYVVGDDSVLDFGGRPFTDAPTAADCTGSSSRPCRWCGDFDACPYVQAKRVAQARPLTVLNTAYALTDALGPRNFTGRRPLAIWDEADLLEGELLSHVGVSISARRAKELGINHPSRKTVEASWVEWIDHARDKVQRRLEILPSKADAERATIKEITRLERLGSKLADVAIELPQGGWVYNYDSRDAGPIEFKPIRVTKWGELVPSMADKTLIMSATIISADQMAEDLGLDEAGVTWRSVESPMTFPVERRPVYVTGVAPMTNKTMNESQDVMVAACAEICRRHPDDRILIHAVSYRLSKHLTSGLRRALRGRRVLTYHSSREKDDALATYLATDAAVMVAPSLDRGIDLAADACRVIVVAKIPYGNLGDKQVNARLRSKGGQSWYTVQTIRTLVQMTGRAMRSADDHATTYILDAQFARLWNANRKLLPGWWAEAVDWRQSPSVKELTDA